MDDATCPHYALPTKKFPQLLSQPSPYLLLNPTHENLTAIQSELKSFIRNVENELADYDEYVACVTHILAKQREAGELFLAKHKRLLIPHVYACPPEIMLEIFLHCLDWDISEARPSYTLLSPKTPIPWILSAVCRRWRNILRESPSYWTSFKVGSQLHFLEDALQISKQAPLYPVINLGNGSGNGSPSCIQALVKHTSRWKTLHVCGSDDAFDSLGQLGNLPNLTSLCISLEATIDPYVHDLLDPEEIMDMTTAMAPFVDCPHLEELSISLVEGLYNNELIFEISSLAFPWENLSKLTVLCGWRLEHIALSLLLVCPNLRELIVNDLQIDDYGDPRKPLQVHSGITSLTLTNPMRFLYLTDYPALTHLSLEDTSPYEILPFLSRSRYHITHFQIVPENGSESGDWGTLLRLLPDVVHFTVRLRGPKHQLTWEIISASLETQLPQLRTLVVHIECHLLPFCESWDIVPLVRRRWSARQLETLEIHSMRVKDWSDPELGQDRMTVSWSIEESAMIKALLGFKAEGLEVNINDIPLSERSALLYM